MSSYSIIPSTFTEIYPTLPRQSLTVISEVLYRTWESEISYELRYRPDCPLMFMKQLTKEIL